MSTGTEPRRQALHDLPSWLVRRRWRVLVVWTVLWSALHVPAHGWGWHWFEQGARILTSGQALHLYAHDPELQSGPLPFLLLAPFVAVSPLLAEGIAIAVMAALGLVAVRLAEVAVTGLAPTGGSEPAARPVPPQRVLVVGLLVVPVWSELAVHWTHPDDALALVCLLGALAALARRRPVLGAVLLACAVDAKPWAIVFVPLLMLAPAGRRPRAALVWLGVVALAWAPFVLADAATLRASAFRIPVSDASVLHLVGVTGDTPWWCRPAQLVLGLVAVTVAVRRRWSAALLVGICARMLLDPATKTYYDAGLIVGTAVYDLAAVAAVPWLTLSAFVAVFLPDALPGLVPGDASLPRSLLRAAFLVVAPLVALRRHPGDEVVPTHPAPQAPPLDAR